MSAFAARIGSGGWPLSRVQRSHCHPYRRRSVLQSLVMTLVQAESSTTPQTATCEVFLAESFTPGTFGRRNYFGVNWGRRVLVPGFPYALQVSFVVVLRAPAGLAINDLSLALSSSWGDNFKHHAGSLEAPDAELTYVVELGFRAAPMRAREGSRMSANGRRQHVRSDCRRISRRPPPFPQ